MMGLHLSRRGRLGLLAVFVLALIAFFPMRLALGIIGVDRYGVSARSVSGSIWWGRIGQLSVGRVPLGTVHAALSPVQLLVGRARIDIGRKAGLPDDIQGALSAGIGRIGIDDMTGILPLGAATAPLPLGAIEMTDVSARFVGGACDHAEGQVRARITGQVPGLNLSQGLSGTARCEGTSLLLPLVSQSGMEKLDVRLSPDGRYAAAMRVSTTDPALSQGLSAAGFAPSGDGLLLRSEGSL